MGNYYNLTTGGKVQGIILFIIFYLDGVSTKDELVDLVMQIIGGITRMAGETKKIVKAELKRLYDLGKLKKDNLMEVAKKILNDYTIFGDGM